MKTHNILKKIIPFLSALTGLSTPALAQWNLGDIAFTTYNSDGNSVFSFAIMRSITVGEQISFTQNGWFAAGGFRPGENTITVTFSGNYNCGSQFYVSSFPFGIRDESGSGAGSILGTALAFSTSGDQLFAYDPGNVPTAGNESGFIAAIQMNGAWDADAIDANTSAKPSIFTDGVNSVSISPETDNAQYNCTVTSGNPTVVLAPAINTAANWNTDDNTAYSVNPLPCTITCTGGCVNPTVPVLSVNPSTVCPGGSATITIGGSLNNATAWYVYSGSCGGTLVTTSAGGTVSVTPASTTTYYIRGEGGCVTPGACSNTTITVQDVTPPVITCPNNQVGFLNSNCVFVVPDYTLMATASDNCTANPTITQSPLAGTTQTGSFTVTLVATDQSANASNCTFSVAVSPDNTGSTTTTACNSYTVPSGDETYTTSGSYMDTLTNQCGGDSVITINLTVTTVDTSVSINNNVLTSGASGAMWQWVDCNNGFAAVSGATNVSYTASATGTYAVAVTQSGCTDTSACYFIPVGIIENLPASFNVYPNPVSQEFTVYTQHMPGLKKLVMLDVLGNQVRSVSFSGSVQRVSTSSLPSGIYFLQITCHNVTHTLKVVRE